jgi:hypothetical protein
MRKLIDYFWSYVRRGEIKPYEHGPAKKLKSTIPVIERDEYGRWIESKEETKECCGGNCNCKAN